MATPAKRLFRPPPAPARPPHRATSPTYRLRRPTATPLYPVVQHHLETFLARAAEADPLGNGVPWWVEKDFRAYLRCGFLAHGFARARCEDCGHERLIPFSCKGRGICPSCNTRRMAELAAHLTDHVLPHLAGRQWVLSLPKRLRPFLHRNPDIAGAVLRIFLRTVRTTLRPACPGAPLDAQLTYWAAGRLLEPLPEGFATVAPDLAVEIVSPSNTVSEVADKVHAYLAAGARMVWVVDPRCRSATVYRSRDDIWILTEEEALDGGEVLPGLKAPLAEVLA